MKTNTNKWTNILEGLLDLTQEAVDLKNADLIETRIRSLQCFVDTSYVASEIIWDTSKKEK